MTTKLLVIDDDQINCQIVEDSLEYPGLVIETSISSIDALKKCLHITPDIILLDWMMPGMNGMEFLKNLRSMNIDKQPYIIMCTAKAEASNVKMAISAGANTYIVKPFDIEILKQKISQFHNSKQ